MDNTDDILRKFGENAYWYGEETGDYAMAFAPKQEFFREAMEALTEDTKKSMDNDIVINIAKSARKHLENEIKEETVDKFWLVWCMSKGVPTVKHASMSIAVKEAEKLAEKHPGHDFYVMESRAVSKVKNVETEYFNEGQNPKQLTADEAIRLMEINEELKKYTTSDHDESIKMP